MVVRDFVQNLVKLQAMALAFETLLSLAPLLAVVFSLLKAFGVHNRMLGGMLLGLLEAFAASYLSLVTNGAFGAEYKDVVAFLILILILIFRPSGLLGEAVRESKA